MNTFNNPLQNATHMLEQRQAFQAWGQTGFPRWHQKWLGSSRVGVLAAVLSSVTFLSGVGLMVLGFNLQSGFFLVLGMTLSVLVMSSFMSSAPTGSSLSSIFNPILNNHSKKNGVWFANESARTLWGPYPQEKKTQLLSTMAHLDERWAPIKSEVLSLINSDLPYVWWEQMAHEIGLGLKQQHEANAHQRQQDEFIQAQTQVQSQIQPALDVSVENGSSAEPHTRAEKTTNILL